MLKSLKRLKDLKKIKKKFKINPPYHGLIEIRDPTTESLLHMVQHVADWVPTYIYNINGVMWPKTPHIFDSGVKTD